MDKAADDGVQQAAIGTGRLGDLGEHVEADAAKAEAQQRPENGGEEGEANHRRQHAERLDDGVGAMPRARHLFGDAGIAGRAR